MFKFAKLFASQTRKTNRTARPRHRVQLRLETLEGRELPAAHSWMAPATTALVSTNPGTYTVQSGDTLWNISQNLLGDGNDWHQLYNQNVAVIGSNPNVLQVGEQLTLPTAVTTSQDGNAAASLQSVNPTSNRSRDAAKTTPQAATQVPLPARGMTLAPGQSVWSSDTAYCLTLQTDGNLVLYTSSGQALCASGTDGQQVQGAIMQPDGNLVVYGPNNADGSLHALWASNTSGNPGAGFAVLTEGNQGNGNQGNANQGGANQGYGDQGGANQGNDNQGNDNQGNDNQGYDNQGNDNQGYGGQNGGNQGNDNQGYGGQNGNGSFTTAPSVSQAGIDAGIVISGIGSFDTNSFTGNGNQGNRNQGNDNQGYGGQNGNGSFTTAPSVSQAGVQAGIVISGIGSFDTNSFPSESQAGVQAGIVISGVGSFNVNQPNPPNGNQGNGIQGIGGSGIVAPVVASGPFGLIANIGNVSINSVQGPSNWNTTITIPPGLSLPPIVSVVTGGITLPLNIGTAFIEPSLNSVRGVFSSADTLASGINSYTGGSQNASLGFSAAGVALDIAGYVLQPGLSSGFSLAADGLNLVNKALNQAGINVPGAVQVLNYVGQVANGIKGVADSIGNFFKHLF